MQTTLSIIYWLTVITYAVSFILFAIALIFQKRSLMERAIAAAWVGFTLHTGIVAARWIATGHPPFVSYFESMSASVWFGILGYLLIQQWKPFIRPIGAGLMIFVVLLMGWAGTHPFGGEVLPVSLQSFWLFIHASFATAAVGCFIIAASVAFLRLYKTSKNGALDATLQITVAERYDEFNFRLILLGFLFYGIMIVSGSIWAHAAWGRYWGWDPIELWSLITWLMYAVYLHIFFTWKKLRGRFLAVYAISAVFLAGFSLWGVGFVYNTIHTYGN